MSNKIKFEQLPITLGCENRTNYMIIVETVNDEPLHTYLVSLHGFQFYDEKMLYYVLNQN